MDGELYIFKEEYRGSRWRIRTVLPMKYPPILLAFIFVSGPLLFQTSFAATDTCEPPTQQSLNNINEIFYDFPLREEEASSDNFLSIENQTIILQTRHSVKIGESFFYDEDLAWHMPISFSDKISIKRQKYSRSGYEYYQLFLQCRRGDPCVKVYAFVRQSYDKEAPRNTWYERKFATDRDQPKGIYFKISGDVQYSDLKIIDDFFNCLKN